MHVLATSKASAIETKNFWSNYWIKHQLTNYHFDYWLQIDLLIHLLNTDVITDYWIQYQLIDN